MKLQPYVLDLNAGTHYFCACGKSKNLPYCDNSHQGSNYQPHVAELAAPQQVVICRCRQSKNAPFCDGTHATLA